MKIICIGRNYIEHARELNNAVSPEPVFFMKPETALIRNNEPFYYPDFSTDIHHEVEIVLKINKPGKNIPEEFANNYYDEISVGIDFTARDLQSQCKEKGLPWEKAKSFDGSAPVGSFVNKKEFNDLKNIHFSLIINGKTVQKSTSAEMIFSFDAIISYISQFITLKTGDLVFTGTPAGTGPVKIGDRLLACMEDKKLLGLEVK